MTEQPDVQTLESNPPGGEGLSDILNDGLKDKGASPKDDAQLGEGAPNKQPQDTQTQEKLEELFGELLLEDEKKLSFKSKQDLESFIEKNKDLFGKTDHFLRQSDYTKKTQALKDEREQFEQERQKADGVWGEVKPDENSMQAFGSLWSVFQHGSPELQKTINAFMQDVSLLANGQPPAGPLAQGAEASNTTNPEMIKLRRELADLKREMATGRQMSEQEKQQHLIQRAERDWSDWKASREQKGIKIDEELEQAMVPFITALRESEMDANSKLDYAFDLASRKLGRDGKQAIKETLQEADRAKKRSPAPPAGKTPATQEPEPKDLRGILEHGLKSL